MVKHCAKIIGKHMKRPLYSWRYLKHSLQSDFRVEVNWLSNERLREEISNGKSLIRLGDGEISLLLGGSISYQRYTRELKREIKKIIDDYDSDSPFILALPKFISLTNSFLRKEGRFWTWMPFKIFFQYHFNKNIPYADAHIFYKKTPDKFLGDFLKDKTLVIISSKKNIETAKKYLSAKEMLSIETPAENCYERICSIYSELDDMIEKSLPDKRDIVLLAAFGPAAKPLVYHYAKKGLCCLDIGKGLDCLNEKIIF